MLRILRLTAGLSLLSLAPGSPSDAGAYPVLEDYLELQEWKYASEPVDLPAEGMHWQLDVAKWNLDRGSLWLQQPTSGGRVTGFVFRGTGRFEMQVPDAMELRQLRRFARDSDLENLQETFDLLIVRGINLPPLTQLPQTAETTTYSVHAQAKKRHQHWLALRGFDADARVIAALGSSDDAYLRVEMKTRDRGWLTFDYDARRPEEITVEWFNPGFSVLESWLSLDREADRTEQGRPTATPVPRIDIQHLDITADLQNYTNESQVGVADIRPIKVRIEAEVEFEALCDGDQTLQLYLQPWAKVEKVWAAAGEDLEFARDHLGKRSSAIDKKIYDDSLVVLLSEPLEQGQVTAIGLSYEIEMAGFAPGRLWYPSATYPGTGVPDLHTARLTLLHRPNFATKSMGSLVDQSTDAKTTTSIWQIEQPTKMISFLFAKQHHQEQLASSSSTTVTAFSSTGGFISKPRIRELGHDVVQILDFYTQLLGPPDTSGGLVVGLIPSSHGQAFDGLIHIGDFSTLTDRVAERELFRAHEVAHLWWGHQVEWHGYRDQWLSEGFAEYSAMMFVEAEVNKGEKFFQEMLKAYSDELNGSIESAFSQFSRPGFTLPNKLAADRIGPIGHGRRAAVGEAPSAYWSQAYKRGALTLHSLRMILRARTGSDDTFIQILQRFVEIHGGTSASTSDFQSIVEGVTGEDWTWFFDACVYSAEIPLYLWSYEVIPATDGVELNLNVEQRQVEPGFTMAIPLKVEFADGSNEMLLAFMDQDEKAFRYSLPETPKKVVFNPDQGVLARVKKK